MHNNMEQENPMDTDTAKEEHSEDKIDLDSCQGCAIKAAIIQELKAGVVTDSVASDMVSDQAKDDEANSKPCFDCMRKDIILDELRSVSSLVPWIEPTNEPSMIITECAKFNEKAKWTSSVEFIILGNDWRSKPVLGQLTYTHDVVGDLYVARGMGTIGDQGVQHLMIPGPCSVKFRISPFVLSTKLRDSDVFQAKFVIGNQNYFLSIPCFSFSRLVPCYCNANNDGSYTLLILNKLAMDNIQVSFRKDGGYYIRDRYLDGLKTLIGKNLYHKDEYSQALPSNQLVKFDIMKHDNDGDVDLYFEVKNYAGGAYRTTVNVFREGRLMLPPFTGN